VRPGDDRFGRRSLDARQGSPKLNGQGVAFRDRPQSDDRGNRRVPCQGHLARAGDQLDGAQKAGGVAGCEELFGIGSRAPSPPISLGSDKATSRRPSSLFADPSLPPVAVTVV
jgi:hypothetical protein